MPSKPKFQIQAHKKGGQTVVFDHWGQLVATGGDDGYIKIFDVEQGKEIQNYNFKNPVNCLAFSNNNELIVGCSFTKNIKIWNLST